MIQAPKQKNTNPLAYFDTLLTNKEREILSSLSNPVKIQNYLDSIPYSAEDANRCPLQVLREQQAHCLDGGLFAAAMLRRLGYPALVLEMQPEKGMDDDHVLAIYKVKGSWGALAQSNYTGLRSREPIYRNLRELVMSYFEFFYNINGDKTLRSYSRPINLAHFDSVGWMWSLAGADAIEEHIKRVSIIPLLTQAQIDRLASMDELSFQAGRIGINEAGLYVPQKKK